MQKTALIARGLSKNGVRSFIETNLEELNHEKKENYFVFTDEENFIKKYPNLKVVYIKKTNKLLWDNLFLTRHLIENKIDEVIYTKNIIPLLHFFLPVKKVIYVLDLAFKHPKLKAYKWLDSLYMSLFLGFSLKIAGKIIAISDFTKSEIIKFYPLVDREKIIVKHLKINKIFKKITDQSMIKKVIKKYDLKLPFIFYCGSISPRKNVLNLLKAFILIKNEIPHQLYLLSSRTWNAEKELALIDTDKTGRMRIINGVPDKDLVVFYSIADLFVYPSLYEGFGLPIKEAEACGCKILCSNISTSLEIVNKKINYFDPNDHKDLVNQLQRILK